MTFFAIDGQYGTLDPAFDAHTLPTKQWAQAIWDNTYSQTELSQAIRLARLKINNAKGSPWTVVTGPAAAVLLTMQRIGWTLLSPYTATDDRGQRWHFSEDSPAAISKAVQNSVRTWRLERIALALPGIAPNHLDICSALETTSMLIDSGLAVNALLKGKLANATATW